MFGAALQMFRCIYVYKQDAVSWLQTNQTGICSATIHSHCTEFCRPNDNVEALEFLLANFLGGDSEKSNVLETLPGAQFFILVMVNW